MKPNLALRLRAIMRGETISEDDASGTVGVAAVARYALKPAELRQLRPLRVKNDELGKGEYRGVIGGVADPTEPDEGDIAERAALAAGSVRAVDLEAHLTEAQREADRRNADAARRGWTDRFCRCGDYAESAWPIGGRNVWRCDRCRGGLK